MRQKSIQIIFALMSIFILPSNMFSASSRDGSSLSPNGIHRCLVVFVKPVETSTRFVNMTAQDRATYDTYFNVNLPSNTSDLKGNTKYFHEASFGNFILLGDYVPKFLEVNKDDINTGNHSSVVSLLNNYPDANITTAHGLTVTSNDFDSWTSKTDNSADSKIDIVALVYVGASGGNSSGSYQNSNIAIKNKVGVNKIFQSSNAGSNLRHELVHFLLGDNDFHTGGEGAGPGNFLSGVSSYSIINNWNNILTSPNGWDRHRLGWFNPTNNHEISARSSSYGEVNADLVYGGTLPSNGEFILRDFSSFGDAIRIKLPYLEQTSARNQYIWIENHQLLSNRSENSSTKPAGVRVSVQIGNDNTNVMAGTNTNYFVPITSFGNYDFEYSFAANEDYYATITSSESKANPFTGYHLSMQQAVDKTGDNQIGAREWIAPKTVVMDGEVVNCDFSYSVASLWGTKYDTFEAGSKIGVGTNPSTAPLVTHTTNYRGWNDLPKTSPASTDNRTVYLNGLSIEFLSTPNNSTFQGNEVKVRIKWNDFNINEDTRWTGNIVLNEELVINSGSTVILDQGYTPTRAVNPVTIDGEKVFADKTLLSCKPGSKITIKDGAKLIVRNGSKLLMETDSDIEIEGDGQLIIECTGEIECQANLPQTVSRIFLKNKLASVVEHIGSISNYWTYMSGSTTISGYGKRVLFTNAKTIANKTYTSDALEFGSTITTSGAVNVNSGTVKLTARTINLNSGFNVATGASVIFNTGKIDCD